MSLSSKVGLVILVYDSDQIWKTILVIESLRTHGGEMRDVPVFVFRGDADYAARAAPFIGDYGVQNIVLKANDRVGSYIFAKKVRASAQAEELLEKEVDTLIWLEPECLVLNPPTLFDLGNEYDCALRPVHVQNVGIPVDQAPDPFWEGVYEAVGIQDVKSTTESFVDRKVIRAYYNCGVYSIRPSLGILREWLDRFTALVHDRDYQERACRDKHHQIFLHQAVFSALIASRVDPSRIRWLPPGYSYPLHLQNEIPEDRRAKTLNELVCPIGHDLDIDPNCLSGITIEEPLRSWLAR